MFHVQPTLAKWFGISVQLLLALEMRKYLRAFRLVTYQQSVVIHDKFCYPFYIMSIMDLKLDNLLSINGEICSDFSVPVNGPDLNIILTGT